MSITASSLGKEVILKMNESQITCRKIDEVIDLRDKWVFKSSRDDGHIGKLLRIPFFSLFFDGRLRIMQKTNLKK